MMALSACTGFGVKSSKECRKGPHGPPRLVPITIVFTPGKVVENPGQACARPGDTLWFKLRGPKAKLVTVEGKDVDDAWISGSGKNKWFFVPVPVDVIPPAVPEEEFNYTITAEGSLDLDPVVRIKHSF
jgi:hypothetical protein